MNRQSNSAARFLCWSVDKFEDSFYVVAATVDGKDYDFVGNFKSIRDVQCAGRRYVQDHIHGSIVGPRMSLK